MELQNLQEKENKVFKRNEISAELESEVAPSRGEVLKIISEKFKTPEENIEILKIEGNFGSHTFTITAEIYDNKEAKESTVIKSKKQRDAEVKAIEEAKKTAEEESKKAAEKPAEQPATSQEEALVANTETQAEQPVEEEEKKE